MGLACSLVVMGRAHVARSMRVAVVIALFNEANLLTLAFALHGDVVNEVDSAIYEFLFRQKALENELSVTEIHPVQVLSLDLFFCQDSHTVQRPQLRDVEEHLQSVEFTVLNGVAAEVDLCKQWQVFNVSKLADFPDVVQLNLEES